MCNGLMLVSMEDVLVRCLVSICTTHCSNNVTKRQAAFMLDWLGQEGSRILELHNWSLEDKQNKKKNYRCYESKMSDTRKCTSCTNNSSF